MLSFTKCDRGAQGNLLCNNTRLYYFTNYLRIYTGLGELPGYAGPEEAEAARGKRA